MHKNIITEGFMAFVQTSPFLGQVFKLNGEVHVIDDMSGHYRLFDGETDNMIGEVIVEKVNYQHTTCLQLKVPLLQVSLLFDEMPVAGNNIGCKCWLGSFANIIYITCLYNDLKGKVLELGTGVGALGITLGKTNIYLDIVISDGCELLCATTMKNVEQNEVKNVLFKTLKWGKDDLAKTPYDIIMGCECVYKEHIDDLSETILDYLSAGGRAYFMNTPHPYRKGIMTFIQKLKQHGQVILKELYLLHNDTNKAPFIFIEFRKSNSTV